MDRCWSLSIPSLSDWSLLIFGLVPYRKICFRLFTEPCSQAEQSALLDIRPCPTRTIRHPLNLFPHGPYLFVPGGLQCPAPAVAAKHTFQAWRRFARSALRNDSLSGRLRRGVVVAMTDPLAFKFVDTIRPPCSKCGRPLVLTRIEPEEPGFDLRTYYCAACESTEVIIAAI